MVRHGGNTHLQHQLIVIGNGFDLACNLETSYTSFFSPRIRIADSMSSLKEEAWREKFDAERLTVWDFILRLGIGGTDWCNVEKAMGEWVLPANTRGDQGRDGDEASKIEQLLGILDLPVFQDNPPRIDEHTDKVLSKLTTEPELRLRDVARCVWHKAGYRAGQGMGRSKLLAFFRSELECLESQFRGYLLGQDINGLGYANGAVTLLADIACEGLSNSEEGDYDKERTSVLSFNYTTPFITPNTIVDEKNTTNIHGDLTGEIIFGVDGKECMGDLDALPFTKTYRVASMGIKTGGILYSTAGDGAAPSETDSIKFFGHSLGEADYSYFQSIFDGVNLYGGNTRLVFYYRPWKGKDQKELHTETVTAVTNLLTTYGGTLDNKDHGKNLMHKLLLEGRLEIKMLRKRAW